jgi:hypothetical protein
MAALRARATRRFRLTNIQNRALKAPAHRNFVAPPLKDIEKIREQLQLGK